MSIELCFFINLLSDFPLIAATARAIGCCRLRNTVQAAALAALYGTVVQGLPILSGPPFQILALILLSMLATGRNSVQCALTFALSLVVAALVTGTCAAYFHHTLLSIAIVPMLCSVTTRLRRRCLTSLPVRIEVVNRGHLCAFSACIDTGNRLREPLSGQPVLIVNAHLLSGLLPESGYRNVAYGSVGGAGTLQCFRPDHITVVFQGRRRRAPDTWIALFPGHLPGFTRALAPADYALC